MTQSKTSLEVWIKWNFIKMSRPVRYSAQLSKTQNISYIILRCQETFNHVQGRVPATLKMSETDF